MAYRITETLLGREVNRSTLERAKLIAYDMMIRMVHDNTQLGREVRNIHKWEGGRPLRVRYGEHFVTLEKA